MSLVEGVRSSQTGLIVKGQVLAGVAERSDASYKRERRSRDDSRIWVGATRRLESPLAELGWGECVECRMDR